MLRKFLPLLTLLVLFIITSCSHGPKPDKRITATLRLADPGATQDDLDKVMFRLEERFRKFGATPNIQKTEKEDVFSFEFETAGKESAILKMLVMSGKLEFFRAYDLKKQGEYIFAANTYLKERGDSLINPLVDKLLPVENPDVTAPYQVALTDTAYFNQVFKRNDIRNLFGEDRNLVKLLWGKEVLEGMTTLYFVKTDPTGKAVFDGETITQAAMSFGYNDMPTVSITMNPEGALKWEQLTARAFEENFRIAIVVDDVVYSAPGVSMPGGIAGGRSEISGGFSEAEAQELAMILEAGSIPTVDLLTYNVEMLEP